MCVIEGSALAELVVDQPTSAELEVPAFSLG
jgi:hypothetical protein